MAYALQTNLSKNKLTVQIIRLKKDMLFQVIEGKEGRENPGCFQKKNRGKM